ncbi:MAG: MarC family protein [Nitrospirae bacterium]|jgi:multiple antibiotic resistance protein|nr:MarC family protein [Nitrospirota bacterium]
MLDIIKILPNTFIPLFVAIDVFLLIPIFISMTAGMPSKRRQAVVRDSILTAIIVSLAFIALGEAIFRILGITGDDFKIGGGLVLLVFAILDLTQQTEERRKPDIKMGVVPIGVPLIVGPAVLTTTLVLVDHYGIIPTIISLTINLFIVWVSLINAERIIKIFGKGGIIGISKVMALLLASIAIMMIRLGVENIIKQNI